MSYKHEQKEHADPEPSSNLTNTFHAFSQLMARVSKSFLGVHPTQGGRGLPFDGRIVFQIETMYPGLSSCPEGWNYLLGWIP